MSCIVVSGLVNVETTLNIGHFPVEYTPIEYKFFGLKSNVAGVAYNVAKALVTLENNVELLSMLGKDGESKVVLEGIQNANIQDKYILNKMNTITQVLDNLFVSVKDDMYWERYKNI